MFWNIRRKPTTSRSAGKQFRTTPRISAPALALAVSFMVLWPGTRAGAQTPPIITEIRERYQVCRQLRADKAGLSKLYGVYTDLEKQERPVWHQAVPEQGMALSEITQYAPRDGQTGFAELSETTPSGDWSKATEYCFRTDGSLAFVFSIFRTFFGNVRVEDRIYFDRQGQQVRFIRRIFDLNSGNRLPDSTSNFADRETRIFKSTQALGVELAPGGAESPTTAASTATSTAPSTTTSTATNTADQDALNKLVGDLVAQIEAAIEPQMVSDLAGLRSAALAPGEYTFLANAAYLNHHAEIAAWFFAHSILAGQMNAQALNNLALALEDSYLADAGNRPKQWLPTARTLLGHALSLAPGDALIHNNLGWNAFRQWQHNNDPALLEQAAGSLEKAISIEPNRTLPRAHLAEVLLAQGKADLARKALDRAHQIDSAGPAFLAVATKPGWADAPEWSQSPRRHCDVNYKCQQTCPPSIIGRIKVITCEFDQDSARQACAAGKPFARSYRCEEEIPEYGILIPGLNSGFSIVTPWGRVDITMNGAGEVNYRVKGGPKLPGNIGAELEARGTYTPDEGLKVQRVTRKFSLNIPTGTAVGKQLEQLNMGPATVSVTDEAGGTLKVESFDSTLWAH